MRSKDQKGYIVVAFQGLGLFLLTAVFLSATPVVTVATGAATVNSFNTGDAVSPWVLDISVAADSRLLFSDTDGDVLGPSGRRSISVTLTSLVPVTSFEFGLGSPGPKFNTSAFGGFGGDIYFDTSDPSGSWWVNSFFPLVPAGGTLLRGFEIRGDAPLSGFTLALTPNSPAIPEPSTITLVADGAAALLLHQRYNLFRIG